MGQAVSTTTRFNTSKESFIKNYINYVINNEPAKLPKISQHHHLLLFIISDGLENYFNEQFHTLDENMHIRLFTSHDRIEPKRFSKKISEITNNLFDMHKYIDTAQNNQKTMFCVTFKNSYKINTDCSYLNVELKEYALTELHNLELNHLTYRNNNENELKNKLLQLTEKLNKIKMDLSNNVSNSNALIVEGTKIQKQIDEITKKINAFKNSDTNPQKISGQIERLKYFISILET